MIKLVNLIKTLVALIFVGGSLFLTYDYHKYKKSYYEASKKVVNQTADDILILNIDLKNKISQILIEQLDLFIKLTRDPENTDLIKQANTIFTQQLPSFYTFSLADKHGEIITDIFFEKVGRLCRQDIKQFALHESNSWLTIHPGLGKYHYDLILPWQYAELKKIIFISFNINSLVSILQKNKRVDHELYLVRKDKDNLIELSSSGSRAQIQAESSGLFLDDKYLQGFSRDINSTYWTVIELPNQNLLSFYLTEIYSKILALLS